MSDTMETGGVGKNPAIDKINNLNIAENRANAVLELEKRVFQTESFSARAVLRRRRQVMEDFQINFKRGRKGYGDILHEREQRLYTGEYFPYGSENGANRIADEISGRILSDGGREKEQILSVEGQAKYCSGES